MGCGCGGKKLTRKYVVQTPDGQRVTKEETLDTAPPMRGGQSPVANIVRSAPVPSFNNRAA